MKNYKNLLEKAQKAYKNCVTGAEKRRLEYIFTELKESEDEQHRKWILEYLYDGLRKSNEQFKDQFKAAIAWLEKQGEKESDPRYENLEEILAADDIYQMSMNDEMVQEAKEKAVNALSVMCIGRLLGLEKQGEQGNQHLYDIIIALWDLLDKIDTFADLQIDDTSRYNPFRKIEDITRERHKFVKSDGYNLYIKGEKITDFQEQNTMMFNSTKESKCEENDSSTACLENQCEQKSVSITDEWIEDYWQHEKVNNPYSYDKGDEIQFDHQGFVRFCKKYCKKPTDEEMKTSEMQKPEPKFKVRDWVVYNTEEWREVLMVDRVDDGIYHLVDVNGETCNAFFEEECNMRLWGIGDAKDGDVLTYPDNTITLFKNLHKGEDEGVFTAHCLYEDNIIEEMTTCAIADIHPATKEQRDLLFSKMREAGYEWDADKKELKKIEQKPVWSEENSCYYDDICEILINLINSPKSKINKDAIQKDLDWLTNVYRESQLKPAWSEEDELNFKQAIYVCHQNGYTAVENWLKSLKPKKQWKPKDYDISLLEEIARKIRTNTKPFCSDMSSLENLIENLKSL